MNEILILLLLYKIKIIKIWMALLHRYLSGFFQYVIVSFKVGCNVG